MIKDSGSQYLGLVGLFALEVVKKPCVSNSLISRCGLCDPSMTRSKVGK